MFVGVILTARKDLQGTENCLGSSPGPEAPKCHFLAMERIDNNRSQTGCNHLSTRYVADDAHTESLAVADSDSGSSSEHPFILIPPRENDFNETTWWMVDLNSIVEGSSYPRSV